MFVRRALQWVAAAWGALKVELEPLFHPDYKGARESCQRRFEESAPKFLYGITFVGTLQMLFDPNPTMRAFFVTFVAINGGMQVFFHKRLNLLCTTAVGTGIVGLAVRMLALEGEFFTRGYDVIAIWIGPIVCVGIGARSGAAAATTSYFLLKLHASAHASLSTAHTLCNARAVLILMAFSSLLSEARKVREEFVSERLRERTAEALEFEMQAAAAKTEVAHAKAAQLAAEADKALAAKLRAEDQRRTTERLYHKVLTRMKVPLVLARSEMQACRTKQSCPGCCAAEHRINELWQLLTAPTGASCLLDDGVNGPPRSGDDGRAPRHSAGGAEGGSLRESSFGPPPSAGSTSSGNWSLDTLHEFKEVSIAFDAEQLAIQRVTIEIQEPGTQGNKRPVLRLDQWVVPTEWERVEGWIQRQVNAVLNGRPTQDYESSLCLRWPGESFVQVKVASIAWLEDPLESGGRGDELSNEQAAGGSEDGSEESYCDGHFALLLSELSIPVPSRHNLKQRRRRHQSSKRKQFKCGNTDFAAQVPPQLDCVEEFCSVAEETEEEAAEDANGTLGPN